MVETNLILIVYKTSFFETIPKPDNHNVLNINYSKNRHKDTQYLIRCMILIVHKTSTLPKKIFCTKSYSVPETIFKPDIHNLNINSSKNKHKDNSVSEILILIMYKTSTLSKKKKKGQIQIHYPNLMFSTL